MSSISISQWPQPIAAGRQRILEAALDAGVPYPHGCGTGECGSCKSLLMCGEVTLDRYSPDALSDDERASGLILACRARPVSDVQVRWLSRAAPMPMTKVDATVRSLERIAHDVLLLTLALPAGARFFFRPGQFAKLKFGRLPARSYSMANQPGDGTLVFHIRVVPDGKVSSHVAAALKPGDPVEVRGPFGDAYWDGQDQAPLLLLAGGTGLAPILSVLDAALADGHQAEQIHVYHGVRSDRDLYAGDTLAQRSRRQGFRFVPVLMEAQDRRQRAGFLHDAVALDFDNLAAARVHVAGPPPMVDAVREVVSKRGAAAQRVRADAFHAAEPEKKSLWERITGWGGLE